MATPPVLPQPPTNFESNPPPMGPTPPQQPPGTDMTGICFRDQLWLNTYPLDRNLVFDYFALSPFYDWTCNNEQLRSQSIHPLDLSHLLDGLCIIYQRLFGTAASKLEKIGYVDSENEGAASESKTGKEVIDFKEVKRIDHILASLQRKLPPAPPPPSFPEGYVPQPTTEEERGPETQQGGEPQLPPVDPIIDQGPAKRMKF